MSEALPRPSSSRQFEKAPIPEDALTTVENDTSGIKAEDEQENPNDKRRAMDHALQHGTPEDLMSLFDNGMDIDQEDFQGRTALMLSASKGKTEIVEVLLARDADVNHVYLFQDRIPMTALDAAQQTGRHGLADILRAHGAKTGKEVAQQQEKDQLHTKPN